MTRLDTSQEWRRGARSGRVRPIVFTALAVTALVLASPAPAEPSLSIAEAPGLPRLEALPVTAAPVPRTLTPAEALVEGILYRVAVVKPILVAGLPHGSRLFLVVVPVEGHTVLQAVGSW